MRFSEKCFEETDPVKKYEYYRYFFDNFVL